ncbi:aminotransferase class I/II-fold pyridoxal phosphate-dependent enzyme [Haloferula chungangensis]|uniref:Aminotransferase class I/II-fold pyridoxal phosphate-dependent enzyme n=1 Tax=Haloferula chungangensis TaxID=1048331 RepID=A0ABW2L097_9BACT
MPSPQEELDELASHGLLRTLKPLDSASGPQVIRDGRPLWNFASNDYLGLANDPRLVRAFQEGLSLFGAGAAASRLITGTLPPHDRFEQQLAAAKRSESALLFSSGFATALGTIPAIVGKGDHIILDKLSHASLIDGAKLSGATIRVFPHNNVERLAELLESIRAKSSRRILILTESVFSMDGDLCPLREIVSLKDKHDALLLLDEAHGFGVLGPTGMGLGEALGLQDHIDFHMGTLSKAAGLSGAYITCSAIWRDLLINRARSFIYSTAPPPALAHAASTALDIIVAGTELRSRLQENIRLIAPDATTPIIPRVLGDNNSALNASIRLAEKGFIVPAIRYPTVPRGTARLRISLSAAHQADTVRDLGEKLAEL